MMLATGRGHKGCRGGLGKAMGSSLFRLHFILVRVGSAPEVPSITPQIPTFLFPIRGLLTVDSLRTD